MVLQLRRGRCCLLSFEKAKTRASIGARGGGMGASRMSTGSFQFREASQGATSKSSTLQTMYGHWPRPHALRKTTEATSRVPSSCNCWCRYRGCGSGSGITTARRSCISIRARHFIFNAKARLWSHSAEIFRSGCSQATRSVARWGWFKRKHLSHRSRQRIG